MDLKRALGLALCAVAFALVVWGLFLVKFSNTVSIKIDLPPAGRVQAKHAPIEVEILTDGTLRVEGAPSTLDTLPRDVAAKASSPPETQEIRIRASGDVSYATFTAVLERLKGVGWTKVGVVPSIEAAP